MSLVGSTPTGHPNRRGEIPRHSFGPIAHSGRAPHLQCGGGRGRADKVHQISPVAYARSIRSAENGESSVQLAGLAPTGNSVMRCIRALGARGLSSILSSPTKLCASVPERIDGLRYERSVRGFESCRALQIRATVKLESRDGESTQCLGPSNAT